MNTRIVAVSIVSLGLSAMATAETQAPQVTLVTLPAPPGGSGVSIVDMNAAGDVLGGTTINSHAEIVEWVGGKTPVVYPRLPGDQGANKDYFAVAINKSGAVIGTSRVLGSGRQPSQGIYWDAGRHPTAVPEAGNLTGLSEGLALAGTTGSRVVDLQYATRWTSPTVQPIVLAFSPQLGQCATAPSGFCTGFGGPISPNGRYVFGYTTEGESRAYEGTLYVDGSPASNVDAFLLKAFQITDAEVIVGSKDTGIRSTITQNDVNQAYRFEAGVFIPLGALPGAPAGTAFESQANSINSSGVIVGHSEVQLGGFQHAVMWINDQIIDLHAAYAGQLPANTIATDAYAINDSGQFVLVAQNTEAGTTRYYVAKPLVPTHTTITSNINPSPYGQQIHLVAKVTPDSGPVPTTGSVSWYDNGALVGTARMTGIGTSSWEPSTWTAGVHNVTAVFPAAGALASSTSPVFKQTVNAASTRTTVSAAPSPATHGQSVKLTATVVPTSGTIAGTVTFKSGTTVLGTGTLDARTKQTSLTTSFAKAGSYAITASFAGSQNFTASSSAALTLTVK
jgi:hypothetical protein